MRMKMKNKLTVLIDMDGTINDFQTQMLEYIKEAGYKYDKKAIKSYDMEVGVLDNNGVALEKEKQRKVVERILYKEQFWLGLLPLPGSVKCLKWINEKHDLKIVTIPFRFNDTFQDIKITWLEEYYPFINPEQVIFERAKWNVPGEIIIEDKPATLEKCMSETDKIVIAVDRLYNKKVKVDYRIKDWSLDQIKNIIKRI